MSNYSKEIYQNQWIMTDDAFLQHGCPTSEDGMQWEFVQVDQVPGEEERYAVSHAHMDLRDYSEDEVNDMLHSYGYDNFFTYVMQFPDFYKQGLLEMFFETEIAGQNMSPAKSFSDAVAEVESITGSDLTQYKQPDPKSQPTMNSDNVYYKASDGWFDYYVNVCTGQKKFKLDKTDICTEKNLDDFSRDRKMDLVSQISSAEQRRETHTKPSQPERDGR